MVMVSCEMIYALSFMRIDTEALTLVLLMRGIYEIGRRDWVRCHDVHTKFHKDRFWH
jgi:hypothetical protein